MIFAPGPEEIGPEGAGGPGGAKNFGIYTFAITDTHAEMKI